MEVAARYQFVENWLYFIILMVDGQEPPLSLSHNTMALKQKAKTGYLYHCPQCPRDLENSEF